MIEKTLDTDKSELDSNSNIFNISVDLVATLLATFVALIVIFFPYVNDTVFRSILSSLIVIFTPGYALTAALFPRKADLSNVERVALAFGLSIAILALLAAPLSYFGPITLISIVGILTLFVTTCSIIGFLRRTRLSLGARFSVAWIDLRYIAQRWPKNQSQSNWIVNVLVAVSLLLSISVVAFAINTP